MAGLSHHFHRNHREEAYLPSSPTAGLNHRFRRNHREGAYLPSSPMAGLNHHFRQSRPRRWLALKNFLIIQTVWISRSTFGLKDGRICTIC